MISVIGLGFVGLTTALGFSRKGFVVRGFEIDEKRRDSLKNAKIPFAEPHLDMVLRKALDKNFFLSGSLKELVEQSNVIFFCVDTPKGAGGEIDLKPLLTAVQATIDLIPRKGFEVIAVKSTVPPSTTREIVAPLIENNGFKIGRDIGLVNNPEFLREGHAWHDFMKPDRIIIGRDDKRSGATLTRLYKRFGAPIYEVSLNTAEFVKYLSNTLLATMISYSNEMSFIANSIGGIDIQSSFRLLHLDRRWHGRPAAMSTYVFPGCGFGGHCLPKDTHALYAQMSKTGYVSDLLMTVLKINERAKQLCVQKVCGMAQKGECIGILGLSFKPGTDDVRETPALDVIKALISRGYENIVAYDPLATDNFRRTYNFPIRYAQSVDEVVNAADHVMILTAWEEFRRKKRILMTKNVIDCRHIL